MSFPRLCIAVVALGAASAACSPAPSTSYFFTPDADASTAPVPAAAPARYSVGGTVTGLVGSGMILTDGGGDDLAVTANGSFVFPSKLTSGASFAIDIKRGPSSPQQTCRVLGGTGTVVAGDVTSVVVTCATDAYVVGGTVSGLAGFRLSLTDGTSVVAVASNGTFAFPKPITDGAAYAVSVATSPVSPKQTCAVANSAGTVASADVSNVAVTCTTNQYAIGGHVTGLVGSGLVLENESGDDLPVPADGAFTFATHANDGAAFAVTVKTSPTGPAQTCSVTGGTGTLAGGDVSTVMVVCDTNTFAVGGTVSGLVGSGLVLEDNASDDATISSNGTFAFGTALADQAAYAITVKTQPTTPWQTCAVDITTANGTVSGAAVTTPSITCTTNTYAVGGTLTGLPSGESVILQNSGGDDLTLSANGTFTFATAVASGVTYNATVLTSPASPVAQTCTVTQDSARIVAGDAVTSIAVSCAANTYSLGGTISGLGSSDTITLQNEHGDDITVGNGPFTFATAVSSGAAYAVTVETAPAGFQCTVTNDSGTMADQAIGNVSISCGSTICAANLSFNDGQLGPWTSLSISTPIAVNSTAAVNGTADGFSVSGHSNHFQGAQATWVEAQPSSLSWWEYVDASGNARGYFIPKDAAGHVVFWLYAFQSAWQLADITQSGSGTSPFAPNTWIHLNVTFDWVNKKISVTLDGQPWMTDADFRDASATGIAQLNLYNFSGDAVTYYDEIQATCSP